MCGIAAFYTNKKIPKQALDALISGLEKRGQDGVGVLVYNLKTTRNSQKKWAHPYSTVRDEVLNFITDHYYWMKDTLIFISCRATPETELETTEEMLQPIVTHRYILVHNGGVTDSIVKELKANYRFDTNIDSEAIIHAVEDYGGIENAMKRLSGSFAFVLYDKQAEKLHAVTSFNPLAEMHIRDTGHFFSSSLQSLYDMYEWMGGRPVYNNVWHDWYAHYLRGYLIKSVIVRGGEMVEREYAPYFMHPTWEPYHPTDDSPTEWAYVCASGGIDSGLTAWILHLVGLPVTLLHFKYGQRGQTSELWGVKHLQKEMSKESTEEVKLSVFDLKNIYKHKIGDVGQLTRSSMKLTTGGDELKSTIAWVSGRNAVFASLMMARAEADILKNKTQTAYLAAGWAQLSEETGGYPDNSFKFNASLNTIKNYGYITGKWMQFLPVCSRLTKTEQWVLGAALNFPFQFTVSCDNPKYEANPSQVVLCEECGSTKLSRIAARRAGIADPRMFYDSRGIVFVEHNHGAHTEYTFRHIKSLVERLVLPRYYKSQLIERVRDDYCC